LINWNHQAIGKIGLRARNRDEIYNEIKTRTRANKTQTRKRRGLGFDIQKLLGLKDVLFCVMNVMHRAENPEKLRRNTIIKKGTVSISHTS